MRFMGAIGVAPDISTYKKLALGCRRSSDGLQLLKEMKVSRSHKPLRLGTQCYVYGLAPAVSVHI